FKRSARSPVLPVANYLNFRVSSFQVIADQSGRIAAAVVYYNDLPSRRNLGEDLYCCFHCASDIGFLVECRKDDRYVPHGRSLIGAKSMPKPKRFPVTVSGVLVGWIAI